MDPSSDDLSPLPADHRRGLIAVAVLAAFSFVSSTVVLLYLSVKLARWHIRTWRQNRKSSAGLPPVDLSLGLTEQHFMGEDAKRRGSRTRKRAHPNQFLILIYNLLLADIHQAASFLLNAVWVGRNGIQVRTSTCWAQGWLVQTGDLASSLFITAIALHTYLAVVWNYTPPQSAIYITVVFLWGFNYLLVIIGIAITGNGKEAGGFFVRASAWVGLLSSCGLNLSMLTATTQCWINIRYEGLRLYLHYLWIFVALAITSVLYTLIFLAIRKRNPNNNTNLPPPTTNNSTTNIHTIPSPTTPHHLSHTPSSSITSNSKSPSHTTLTDRPSAEEEEEQDEKQKTTTFAPLRPANAPRRLSIETLSTLRRERSNNGWGVDDIEEDAAGAGGVIAPYNHPAAAEDVDPFEVGWEGGDADPLCPRAMPQWRKWVIVGITSVGSFCV